MGSGDLRSGDLGCLLFGGQILVLVLLSPLLPLLVLVPALLLGGLVM